MNIMLVRPKPHFNTIGLQSIMICEPLELEYLAASIQNEHQVVLVDMIIEKKPLTDFIIKHQPEVIGLTGYIAHVNVIKNYAAIIKQLNPHIKVVVGGVHAEVVGEDFVDPNIDFIIIDSGLKTFPKLMGEIQAGLYQKQQGPIFLGGRTEEIPDFFPDRNITNKYRPHYYYVFHNPCALIKTSYGCPYSCSFCFCRQITGDRYYERQLIDVIEELKEIKETEIYIVDDNFLYSPKRVEKFCDLLEAENIQKKFLIYGRADFIAKNETTIKRFADLGLRAVIVGLETAKEEELKFYNKKTSIAINEQAIQILAKNNVDCYATLILGIDWAEEDFASLARWLKKWNLRFINLQPFTPLPGTPLYAEYQEKLIISRDKYEQWDLANLVVKPTKLSIRRYYFNILKVYFQVTLNYKSLIKNLQYGLVPNLNLSLGVARITWQYTLKILKG